MTSLVNEKIYWFIKEGFLTQQTEPNCIGGVHFHARSHNSWKSFIGFGISVRPSNMFPLEGFASSLILETSMRTCREIPNLVKNWGIKYGIIYMMDVNMLYCCQQSYIAIKALSSREMASGCKDSRGSINIRRTRRYVTLYTHCLSFIVFPNYKISCFFYNENGSNIGKNLAIHVVCHSPEQNVEYIPNFPSTCMKTI